MRKTFLLHCSICTSIASAQFSGTLAGGPTSVAVGQTQTFAATLPAPPNSGYYVQFYLRISSSASSQGTYTCNTIADPVNNKFYMEADGPFGSNPVPWIPGAGKTGGSNDSWSNGQCTLQLQKSRVFINPDRSATVILTVSFTNPTPQVPHSTLACPANCDSYAPGPPFTVGERYWYVAGLRNDGNWHYWATPGPVLPTPTAAEWLWASPNFISLPATQTFQVKIPKRYYPLPYLSWNTVELRFSQPYPNGHANQGAIPSIARQDSACTVIAYPGSNTIDIGNDAGTGYSGAPVGAPSSNTKSNNQCILNAAASNMSVSNGDVTVNFNVTFRQSFAPGGTGGGRWMWVRGTNGSYVTEWIAAGWVNPTGTISGGGDTTPPSLSRVASDPTMFNSMISWKTNEASNTQVYWGQTTAYGNQTTPSQPSVLDHSAMLQGLAPGTKYYYQARSTDAAGNTGVSSGQFRTDDTWPQPLCSTVPNPAPFLQCTSLLSEDVSGVRWEPSSATGTDPATGNETWVHVWYEFSPVGNSYYSYWTGTSWSVPVPLRTGDNQQLVDVNLTWDPIKHRFAYAAGTLDGSTWYGHSSNSLGSSWDLPTKILDPSVKPVNPPAGFNYWDYPSIAINTQGRVAIAAVGDVNVGSPPPAPKTAGYYAALIDADYSGGPVVPTTIVQDVGVRGQGARLVAAGSQFQAFLTANTPDEVPTRLDRWGGQVVQLSNGGVSLQWDSNPSPIKDFSSAVPFVLAPLPSQGEGDSSRLAMSTTNISASGSPDGNWAVAFQTRNGATNIVWICSSDRLCGYTNDAPEFQFLPSVSISHGPFGPNYWLSYLALQPDESVRVHSWLLRPGLGPVGIIEPVWISPYGWAIGGGRCGPLNCRSAGDFITSAASYTADPRAKVSIPMVTTRLYPPNNLPNGSALHQLFLRGPIDGSPSSLALAPPASSWVTFPPGSSHRSSGAPHGQKGPNFANRRLIYSSRQPQ